MNLHQLSDTSSLVLLWTDGTIHTSENSKTYLKLLDLNSGKKLLSECNKIWSHYSEVIKNRKKCLLDLIIHEIISKEISQVVIFGSGMDALSLEILSKIKDVIVYEIDNKQMNDKKNLIKQVNYKLNNSIKCITSDLTRPKMVMDVIKMNGWRNHEPSIFVFEGISYFLTEKNLWDLIKKLKTKNQKNTLFLEYLLHPETISKNRSYIPEYVFNTIQKNIGSNTHLAITRYKTNTIKDHIEKLNGHVIQMYTMKDMEKNRIGCNIYFKTNKSGWIEICLITI